MRRSTAALTLAALLLGAHYAPRAAFGAPLRDNASTGGAPRATSFIYPVGDGSGQPTWTPGNANGYFITQNFNNSCDPALGQGYYMNGFYYCGHTGVDLATQSASDVVRATAAGVVVSAGYNGSFGVMVRIRHTLPDGSAIYSQYEHMAYGSLAVYTGQVVTQGQQIGLVGATGFATGAHLHFEIKSVDEDGWGYTFGNDALIAGYQEPIGYVAAHSLAPVSITVGTGKGTQVWPAESEAVLKRFLGSYAHFVTVKVDRNDGLHVRSGPSLKAKVLGTALRGAKLGYVRTQGDWLYVSLPQNVRGWVNVRYVAGYQDWTAPAKAKARVAARSGGPLVTVDTTALYVRSGPGQNHLIISSVYQGDRLPLLTRTANWDQVSTRDGSRGWVLRRWLLEPGAQQSAATREILPNVPALHVRSGPGLQYHVTGAVYQGTRMQFVRATPNWVAVMLPGNTTGWVARAMTSYGTPKPATLFSAAKAGTQARAVTRVSATSVAQRNAIFLTVDTGVLNVRSAPGERHTVVAQVLQGTKLQMLDRTANWAHVALPASTIDGWVLQRYTR